MSALLRSALGVPTEQAVRPIVVIPAYNEADSLPAVVDELRQDWGDLEVLVVDDGSTDGTPGVVDTLGVRSLRLHQRVGVGGAMRAGLRFAQILGFNLAVRMDGDGQHRADQIPSLIAPIVSGEADATLGSRYLNGRRQHATRTRRTLQYVLARCMSAVTGLALTDPTSGLWAFGPSALAVLAEHHPTGYPEPELLLFLRRNGLRLVEVPTEMRARLAGESTLTWSRSGLAAARVLLALLIVPLRSAVRVPR